MFPAERIVCLTEETTETIYLLGEERRIVGISGYTVRPPRARKEKPRVSAFISADVPKILALEPDLVLAFSDLQSEIVAALIREGIAVHCFNQRSIAEILDMIRLVGAFVGAADRAAALAAGYAADIERARAQASESQARPKVYFEEWDAPMISCIRWVSELIEAAGGEDVFARLSVRKGAKERIVQREDVIAGAPDIIIGSWCGKKFGPNKVIARAGFDAIPAVRDKRLYEIKSSIILQPGPAALTDGFAMLRSIIENYERKER